MLGKAIVVQVHNNALPGYNAVTVLGGTNPDETKTPVPPCLSLLGLRSIANPACLFKAFKLSKCCSMGDRLLIEEVQMSVGASVFECTRSLGFNIFHVCECD